MPPEKTYRRPSFWTWIVFGIDSYPGILRIVDWWAIVHVAVGWGMTALVPVPLKEAASVILLPLAGVFIGLSFTWVGNAQAILQEERTKQFAKHGQDGYFGLAYTFQLIVLVLLIALSLWALAGLGVFDETWPGHESGRPYNIVSFLLYATASLAVRGCWQAVFGSQFLLLMPYMAERLRAARKPQETAPPDEGTKERGGR